MRVPWIWVTEGGWVPSSPTCPTLSRLLRIGGMPPSLPAPPTSAPLLRSGSMPPSSPTGPHLVLAAGPAKGG